MKKIFTKLPSVFVILSSLTTGLAAPIKKRSDKVKAQYLKQHHLKKIPKGFELDYITLLWKGGSDTCLSLFLMGEGVLVLGRAKSSKFEAKNPSTSAFYLKLNSRLRPFVSWFVDPVRIFPKLLYPFTIFLF